MWGVLMRGLIDVNMSEIWSAAFSFIGSIFGHYICLSVGLIAGTWMGYEIANAQEEK